MHLYAKPAGGLYVGKRLLHPPRVSGLSAGSPVRIAFASDFHIRKNGLAHAETICAALAETKPELLLLGGDYAECDEGAVRLFQALRRALPGVPAFGVFGNNDDAPFEHNRSALASLMRENGVCPLVNECQAIQVNGCSLEIAGVDDAYYHTPNARGLFSEAKGVYRVLLSHQPLAFLTRQASPDLILSGHTHGGQLNLLGLTCYALTSYESKFVNSHISGVKRSGNTTFLVSNGIGVSKLPIRFGARPEIHLITK